ncbi:MAG: hypothetical protein GY866_42730 [Proteobacteria bacterium]|nr:hypothetical protein [Pseudomonadota bacterium]
MKLLLAIIIIAVVSVIGSRITFLNRRLPMGFRNILFTGIEYIFIGVLLGRMGLNILDPVTLDKLEPFLLFGLTWVGFLYGLQFEVRLLKSLPRFYFSITAVQASFTFVVVTGLMYLVLKALVPLPGSVLFMAAVTLGSTASCTAQSAIAIVSRNYRIKNRGLLDLLRYISSVDGLFALLFFALALSLSAGGVRTDIDVLGSLRWLAISVVMGVLPAVILILLSKNRFSQQEYLVFLIGTIMFCGGFSYQIRHSPLIAGLICGTMVANFCRHRLRAMAILVHAEKSIYIFLLLLIGAGWYFKADSSLIVAFIYFFVRIVGKLVGTFTATRIFKPLYKVPAGLGLGLISEGGLAIAIILNFRMMNPNMADPLITIVILSVLVNELLSPRLILAQFGEAERQGPTRL